MSNIGVIILKPDAVQEGISDQMIADFQALGGELLLKKEFQFLPAHIPRILLPIDFLEARPLMVHGYIQSYLSGPSVITVVRFEGVDNATEHIVKLKGKIDTNGIRNKYFPYDENDLYNVEHLEYPNGVGDLQLGFVKCRNRIHSPETEEETLEMLELTLSKSEMKYIENLGFKVEFKNEALKLV